MEQNTSYVCRLCLKHCRAFETIEKSHQEIFNTLLLTLNLAISDEPVVCEACIESLHDSLNFKNVSLHIDENLIGDNGCMFCDNCTVMDKYVVLNSDHLDMMLLKAMMEQFFPELDLKSIPNPLICIQCYERLQKNIDFCVKCLNVEQQIKRYCESVGTNNKGQVDLRNVINLKIEGTGVANVNNEPLIKMKEDPFAEKIDSTDDTKVYYLPIKKDSDVDAKSEVKVKELTKEGVDHTVPQNIAEIYVKCTYDDSDVNIFSKQVRKEDCGVLDTISETIETVIRLYSYRGEETAKEKNVKRKEGGIERKYKDSGTRNDNKIEGWWTYIGAGSMNKARNQQFFPKSKLQRMITTTYVSGEKRHQCQVCMFVTKVKSSMNRHMMLHQHPSELPLFECSMCSFRVTRKADLAKHLLCHKGQSRKPTYMCEYCSYQAATNGQLKYHMVKHKDCPDVVRFECHTCGHKTSRKKNLVSHLKSHRKEDAAYKCDHCSYRGTSKHGLRIHRVRHLQQAMSAMLKCEFCDHETRYKSKLQKHQKIHRDPVKCQYCKFESKDTKTLGKHTERWHGHETLLTKKVQ